MNYTENAVVLNEYMQWLQGELEKRLQQYFPKVKSPSADEGSEQTMQPVSGFSFSLPPDPSYPDVPLVEFIRRYNLNYRQQLVLILALAPHIFPIFFNNIIHHGIPGSGDFPLLGCVKNEQSRLYTPTGETALFLVAGTDLEKRLEVVETIFREERFFARMQILWVEHPSEGEPQMTGKLVMSQEFVDQFLTGSYKRPRFGPDFPADHITTPLDWDDLVLNSSSMEQVKELKKWLRHRDDLLKINKRLKPGFRTLFYGPPGTGKTLTACLLGKKDRPDDREYDVYRIDLSLVVSKFIGETEKSLSRLFDKAENKDWILFFDEADALFGKRTNIRDAHDKYANQEISYLLQRIENYNGLIILASNFKSNIDTAFSRRFQSSIHFPMPDQPERLKLWRMMITEEMLDKDARLEPISGKYEVSGASILNVAQSCFLKKMNPEGKMDHISEADIENAVAKEFSKEGKILK
jgi:AAA+ superfamily predicted ATPase